MLILYRRFIDKIISSIQNFVEDSITISLLEKLWPGNKKKKKIDRIEGILFELKKTIRFGNVEVGLGKVTSEKGESQNISSSSQFASDSQFALKFKKFIDADVSLKGKLSKASLKNADELIKIVYEGLTIINFSEISDGIDSISKELELEGIAILFDEWSYINLEYQPIFAEMIRLTLLAERKLFIKFGCIPFLTNLSFTDNKGQPIGFPVGEEVFVDIDLDKLYNPYLETRNVSVFLLSVLRKHLGANLKILYESQIDEVIEYFTTHLFEDKMCVLELVNASAAIPRDFLRIFIRAFKKTRKRLPINIKTIRAATHELFQEEKKDSIKNSKISSVLFENIYSKILPSKSYCFFVSESVANNRFLQELWHNRLIHLIFQGHFAYAQNKPGTFDIYVVDYGRYISMRSNKQGEQAYQTSILFFDSLVASIKEERSMAIECEWEVIKSLNLEETMINDFAKLIAPTVDTKPPNLEHSLNDCSFLIIDDLIPSDEGEPSCTGNEKFVDEAIAKLKKRQKEMEEKVALFLKR